MCRQGHSENITQSLIKDGDAFYFSVSTLCVCVCILSKMATLFAYPLVLCLISLLSVAGEPVFDYLNGGR